MIVNLTEKEDSNFINLQHELLKKKNDHERKYSEVFENAVGIIDANKYKDASTSDAEKASILEKAEKSRVMINYRNEGALLTKNFITALRTYEDDIARQHFEKVEETPKAIIKDAQKITETFITNRYKYIRDNASKKVKEYMYDDTVLPQIVKASAVIGKDTTAGFLLNSTYYISYVLDNLELHFEALAEDQEATDKLNKAVIETIRKSNYTTEKVDIEKLNNIGFSLPTSLELFPETCRTPWNDILTNNVSNKDMLPMTNELTKGDVTYYMGVDGEMNFLPRQARSALFILSSHFITGKTNGQTTNNRTMLGVSDILIKELYGIDDVSVLSKSKLHDLKKKCREVCMMLLRAGQMKYNRKVIIRDGGKWITLNKPTLNMIDSFDNNTIVFGETFSNILLSSVQRPAKELFNKIMQLYTIPSAYDMAMYLYGYYFNLDAIKTGQNHFISIGSVLDNMYYLPTIETVREDRKSWKERIYIPFENALETLKKEGIIKDAMYCYAGTHGTELSEEDYSNLDNDYETFRDTIIFFSMEEPEEMKAIIQKHDETIQKRAKAKARRIETAKKKKIDKKKKESQS